MRARTLTLAIALLVAVPGPSVAANDGAETPPHERLPHGARRVTASEAPRTSEDLQRMIHRLLTDPASGPSWRALNELPDPFETEQTPDEVLWATPLPTGDVDGDGLDDLFTIEEGGDDIVVARRGDTGEPIYQIVLGDRGIDLRGGLSYLLVADLDSDGVLDFAVLDFLYYPLTSGFVLDQELTIRNGKTGAVSWRWSQRGSGFYVQGSPSPRHGTYALRMDDILVLAGIVADASADGLVDPFVETCDVTFVFAREDQIHSEGACTGTHLSFADGSPLASFSVPTRPDTIPILWPVGDLDGDQRGDLMIADRLDGRIELDIRATDGRGLWTLDYASEWLWVEAVGLHPGRFDLIAVSLTEDALLATARDGATGAEMWAFDYADRWFEVLGDADGDGGADLGLFEYAGSGLDIRAVDGLTLSSALWSMDAQPEAPATVTVRDWPSGDLDGDGVADVRLLDLECPEDRACELVRSIQVDGKTGAHRWTQPRQYGYPLGGDLDADGIGDLSGLDRAGSFLIATMYSGATGEPLWPFRGTLEDPWYLNTFAGDFAPGPGDEVLSWERRTFADVLSVRTVDAKLWELRFGRAA